MGGWCTNITASGTAITCKDIEVQDGSRRAEANTGCQASEGGLNGPALGRKSLLSVAATENALKKRRTSNKATLPP
jgi:hypothetical protein